MEEENTAGSTAQMVGAGALGVAAVALLLSAFGGLLSFCCGLIGMAAAVVASLSMLLSVGALGFGVVTARNEEISEEQAGKAKMGAGMAAGALILDLIAIAFACGPTIVTLFLSLVAQLF
ncbi:MAG: hypothetical protein KC912_01655 [Proteobacteria bacterium]|nr:hypothetical protein [Pseudomonadota bacterium]